MAEVEISDEEIELARRRGEELRRLEPRARTAEYDRATGRVRIELTNGSTFSFPTDLIQGLENATSDDLADITLVGGGYAVHWERIDEGIPVPALMAGRFGNQRHMRALAERIAVAESHGDRKAG